MRTLLLCVLLSACVDLDSPDETSTASPLRSRCPTTDPDCEAPPDPTDPPPPGGGHHPPPREDPACQELVTGSISSNPAIAATTGVPMGTSVTLYWDAVLPTTCIASGPITLNGIEVPAQGSMVVATLPSWGYVLQVGSKQVANLTVNTILPTQVNITANTWEQQALFKQAAETPGTTVLLKHDLELDISRYWNTTIFVAHDVTIASKAPPVGTSLVIPGGGAEMPYTIARDSRHLGPKLYSTLRSPYALLDLAGDNITLRGFRLFGPDMGITDGVGRGIVIASRIGIEIDRLEVAGFSLVALYIKDPLHRNFEFSDITIHDSFFHHNQHAPGGNGYGIETLDGARALIRHNVFDFNRHSIMSGGEAETGYWADENLILRGGGYHEGVAGVTWYTQSFDVHGSDSCGVISILNDQLYNCGRAGDLYWITKNTFQYRAGLAFKLRGTPTTAAYVTDNIFPNSSMTASVSQTETGLYGGNNTLGKDTFGAYGTCDFDGDGFEDLFLATGRTWWFASGGRFHWTYLNNQTEELADLGLGDFNHDGRCDVLRVNRSTGAWELSSAGTGAFAPLPTGFAGPLSQLRFGDFNGDGYTDIFQRHASGQWFGYLAPTSAGPVVLQSSSLPIESLRFGDFDGDRVTDVLTISSGVWSWSRSALGIWRPLNTRYDSLAGILAIANIDGLPGDDVIRIGNTTTTGGELQVSSGGSGPWTKLAPVSWPTTGTLPDVPMFFAGNFLSATADTLLQLDTKERFTTQFSAYQPWFLPHSLYAH